jgi:hypothetical protein
MIPFAGMKSIDHGSCSHPQNEYRSFVSNG